MKNIIFGYNLYQYPCLDWPNQKSLGLNWLERTTFSRGDIQTFSSDRIHEPQFYCQEFVDLFQKELKIFCQDLKAESIEITDVWFVKYENGDWHPPHTHACKGYSGIIYFEYDETVHTPTYFLNPVTDPITDRTNYCTPIVYEGDIVIAPSNLLHFTHPNLSTKTRIILGFDMTVTLSK
jgi:hypothetical protein